MTSKTLLTTHCYQLMALGVPFIMAELDADVNPFVLRLFTALGQKGIGLRNREIDMRLANGKVGARVD